MTRVAILGTGKMGGAMARRLAASGFDLTLWNRTPERALALQLGRVAASPVEAARDADVVISSLTNDVAVRAVYLGVDGVLHSAAGRLLVDASTVGPDVAEALAREAEASGARLVEAPVVGSVPAVETGRLLILTGGARDDVAQARPVLEHLGEVLHVGDQGSAQRMKLIANSMLGITSAAAAELLAAGTAVGLDRGEIFSILLRFAPGLGTRERGFMHGEHAPPMFAVRDLVKDLDLALRMYGDEAAVGTPLTRQARDLFTATMHESADLDISAVAGLAPARAAGR